MNQITVEVTQEHIDRGVRKSCRRCPIALAMKDMGHLAVSVGNLRNRLGQYVFYVDNGTSMFAQLPSNAAQFVDDFDCCTLTASPFKFNLTPRQDRT